jgi:signal transduction histidine kinase
VHLRLSHDGLELVVRDDGVGFDEKTVPRRGLGLVAMRERAGLIGGHIEFARPPDGGTLVQLVVRLDVRGEESGAGDGDRTPAAGS